MSESSRLSTPFSTAGSSSRLSTPDDRDDIYHEHFYPMDESTMAWLVTAGLLAPPPSTVIPETVSPGQLSEPFLPPTRAPPVQDNPPPQHDDTSQGDISHDAPQIPDSMGPKRTTRCTNQRQKSSCLPYPPPAPTERQPFFPPQTDLQSSTHRTSPPLSLLAPTTSQYPQAPATDMDELMRAAIRSIIPPKKFNRDDWVDIGDGAMMPCPWCQQDVSIVQSEFSDHITGKKHISQVTKTGTKCPYNDCDEVPTNISDHIIGVHFGRSFRCTIENPLSQCREKTFRGDASAVTRHLNNHHSTLPREANGEIFTFVAFAAGRVKTRRRRVLRGGKRK